MAWLELDEFLIPAGWLMSVKAFSWSFYLTALVWLGRLRFYVKNFPWQPATFTRVVLSNLRDTLYYCIIAGQHLFYRNKRRMRYLAIKFTFKIVIFVCILSAKELFWRVQSSLWTELLHHFLYTRCSLAFDRLPLTFELLNFCKRQTSLMSSLLTLQPISFLFGRVISLRFKLYNVLVVEAVCSRIISCYKQWWKILHSLWELRTSIFVRLHFLYFVKSFSQNFLKVLFTDDVRLVEPLNTVLEQID